jgi:hypothetical protein
MSREKIATIEELGDLLQTHGEESDQHFRSVGEHLEKVERRLEDIPTRGEIGEIITKAYDAAAVRAELDLMRRNIREKLHVEV